MGMPQKGTEGRYVNEAEVQPLVTKGISYFGNRICPFAQRAWWTAKEVGFESKMDYIHIELGKDKPVWYKGVNPFGTVPCLYVDGHRICESIIVAQYINEVSEGKLMPHNPIKRADLQLLIQLWGDKIIGGLYTVLRTIDPHEDGPFFLGNELSMLEIAIMPFLGRFYALLPYYRKIDLFQEAKIPGDLMDKLIVDHSKLLRLLKKSLCLEQAFSEASRRPFFTETSLEPRFYIEFYKRYAVGEMAIQPKIATFPKFQLSTAHLAILGCGLVLGAGSAYLLKK
eukprot:gene1055-4287_t